MFYNQPRPFFHLGKIPVTVVGLIILAQLIGMIVWTLSGGSILEVTSFTPALFLKGEVWRLFTYPLFSPIGVMPLLGLYFFYSFGMPVETALDRKQFVLLCLSIIFVAPIVLICFSLLGVSGLEFPLVGTNILSLAIFCTFCVMNPNMPFFLFKIPMKWIALVFFLGTVLSLVGARAWGTATSYTLATALAIWMIQSRGLALVKVFPDSWTVAKPKKKAQPKKKITKFKKTKPLPPSKMTPKAYVPADTEIDSILDKISAEGLHSLTPEERATLESASKK